MADKQAIKCTYCFGKGKIEQPESIGSSPIPQYKTCSYCGGTGKIINKKS
jgi:DnaJ-class molecular chaperone